MIYSHLMSMITSVVSTDIICLMTCKHQDNMSVSARTRVCVCMRTCVCVYEVVCAVLNRQLIEPGSISLVNCALKTIRNTDPGENDTTSKVTSLINSTIRF